MISNEIKYATLDKFSLDPMNPRLGRENTGRKVLQSRILDLMKSWALEELAVSFLESGFWPQEAIVVVREDLYGESCLVVVEGNRRLAALHLLRDAVNGNPASRRWAEIAREKPAPPDLFDRIPYMLAGSRGDVESFLGFRHVTGIKEWNPAEKAEYIATMLENRGMTYEEVTRKIGSKTSVVRQNYISYRLLLQMDDLEDISTASVEEKFSVLYLSLRTAGVQRYLHIDIKASPKEALRPVPKARLKALANFALWLFGSEKTPPVVPESRDVDRFGRILESDEAIQYLERSETPNFETAYRLAGGDEPEIIKLVEKAADNVETALSRVHLYVKSKRLQSAVQRFGADAFQLLELFPKVRRELEKDSKATA
jgi:hypothetical protein